MQAEVPPLARPSWTRSCPPPCLLERKAGPRFPQKYQMLLQTLLIAPSSFAKHKCSKEQSHCTEHLWCFTSAPAYICACCCAWHMHEKTRAHFLFSIIIIIATIPATTCNTPHAAPITPCLLFSTVCRQSKPGLAEKCHQSCYRSANGRA